MATILILALLGVTEALAWLYKMRTAVGASYWHSAASTALVSVLRVVFVLTGANAVLRDTPWWMAIGAYAVPATAATLIAHRGWRKPDKPKGFGTGT